MAKLFISLQSSFRFNPDYQSTNVLASLTVTNKFLLEVKLGLSLLTWQVNKRCVTFKDLYKHHVIELVRLFFFFSQHKSDYSSILSCVFCVTLIL